MEITTEKCPDRDSDYYDKLIIKHDGYEVIVEWVNGPPWMIWEMVSPSEDQTFGALIEEKE